MLKTLKTYKRKILRKSFKFILYLLPLFVLAVIFQVPFMMDAPDAKLSLALFQIILASLFALLGWFLVAVLYNTRRIYKKNKKSL